MARPIRETPVLKGEDAFNFEWRRLTVDNMSDELRIENRRRLEERIANAKNKIQWCWQTMRLVPLTPDYELTAFDCGDDQLNEFLFEDAKPSLELRIANTFILLADD